MFVTLSVRTPSMKYKKGLPKKVIVTHLTDYHTVLKMMQHN